MEIAQEKRTRTCRFRCENLRRKREISWRIATWCTRDRWFLVILRRFGVTAVNCSNSIGDISIKRGIREDESGRLLINVGPVSATKTSCSDLRPLRVSFDLSHLSKPEWDVGKFCFRGRCQKQQTDPTYELHLVQQTRRRRVRTPRAIFASKWLSLGTYLFIYKC
jgi:hypothetical protein